MISEQHVGSTLTGATVPIFSSAVSIVYELLCLLLTIAKTFSLYREQQKVGMSTRLTALLLHDGESFGVPPFLDAPAYHVYIGSLYFASVTVPILSFASMCLGFSQGFDCAGCDNHSGCIRTLFQHKFINDLGLTIQPLSDPSRLCTESLSFRFGSIAC